jgi:sodium pump decarboxylase gamma subunit
MKKMKRLAGLFVLAFALVAGSLSAYAEDSIETVYGITEDQVVESVDSWITQLEALTEDEIASYVDSDEMIATWVEASEDAGAYVEVLEEEATYEITDTGFVGEIPIQMENKEIVVKLVYDSSDGSVDVTFSAEGSSSLGLGEIFKKAGMNTLLGMGTVFIMLILISILIWLLGYVVGKIQQPTPEKAAFVPAAPAAPAVSEEAAAGTDNQELAAVIAAAIAASTGTSTDSFVVRSIRRSKR